MQTNIKSNPNILLIQFKPAGDVLLLTPVVKAIKKSLPYSRISFMVNETESVLIKNFKLIDDLILIKKLPKNSITDYYRYLQYNLSIISLIRKNKYDVVIDFIGNPKSAFMTFFSRAGLRIGRKTNRSIVYNTKIIVLNKNSNTITSRLSHLKPLGIDIDYMTPELNLNHIDLKFAQDYFKSLNIDVYRPVVFLAPNSPRSSRRWKAEYFIAAGKALIKTYNAKVLLAWGPGEEDYTRAILKGIGCDAEMIPLTSLTEMAGIISKSDLIITNDSSPKHIANAAGVRSITIYGPTNPFVWNDPDMERNPALRANVPCIQCEKRECPNSEHICMEKVSPDMVMNAVYKLLKKLIY